MLEQLQALIQTRDTVGKALTTDQQLFVSANLMRIHEFIAMPDGQAAIKLFVEEWQKKFSVL